MAHFYTNTLPQLRPLGGMLLLACTWGLGGGRPPAGRHKLVDALQQRFASSPDFDLPVCCALMYGRRHQLHLDSSCMLLPSPQSLMLSKLELCCP